MSFNASFTIACNATLQTCYLPWAATHLISDMGVFKLSRWKSHWFLKLNRWHAAVNIHTTQRHQVPRRLLYRSNPLVNVMEILSVGEIWATDYYFFFFLSECSQREAVSHQILEPFRVSLGVWLKSCASFSFVDVYISFSSFFISLLFCTVIFQVEGGAWVS